MPASGSVTVSVRDTGLGIPPEEQNAIFDEFRRSERSVTRGYGGLGLGLAICKRLVELHGGTIGVRSTGREGAGSVFYFTLPIVEPKAALAPGATPATKTEQGGVLVLTTALDESEGLRQHLAQRGFEVRMALIDQASDWQSRLMVSPPSAVVLDVSIASDEAWNVLKALKANPATEGVPVLFCALSEDSGSVLDLDYLTKPIELAELTRALDQRWLIADDERSQRSRRTFLVVDDDPDTLNMHARIVQAHSRSHRVLKARNGLEALERLQRERVDLVLLDLMMPEMDGFAVLEAMRDREIDAEYPRDRVDGPDADRVGDGPVESGGGEGVEQRRIQSRRNAGASGGRAGAQTRVKWRGAAPGAAGAGLSPGALCGAHLMAGRRQPRRLERGLPGR